ARGYALRVPGRGVRHVPSEAARGHGTHGSELRARAGRGGGRLRPDLPIAPDLRAGRPRLRRVTRGGRVLAATGIATRAHPCHARPCTRQEGHLVCTSVEVKVTLCASCGHK